MIVFDLIFFYFDQINMQVESSKVKQHSIKGAPFIVPYTLGDQGWQKLSAAQHNWASSSLTSPGSSTWPNPGSSPWPNPGSSHQTDPGSSALSNHQPSSGQASGGSAAGLLSDVVAPFLGQASNVVRGAQNTHSNPTTSSGQNHPGTPGDFGENLFKKFFGK